MPATRKSSSTPSAFVSATSPISAMQPSWKPRRSRRGGRWLDVFSWIMFAVAVAVAVFVRRNVRWIPLPYLALLIGCASVSWRLLRSRTSGPPKWAATAGSLLALLLLLPVPWRQADLADPPGTAWRLDEWLSVDGEVVDPPGQWYFLTAGRPPIVAELLSAWLFGDAPAKDLRAGHSISQPRFATPAAAAVGLRAAGVSIDWGVRVELARPIGDGLPGDVVVAALNGVSIQTRGDWLDALATLGESNRFTTADGQTYQFAGDALPYRRVDVIEIPDYGISVGGPLASTPLGHWYRSLAVGRSHGMMVALVTYAHFAGVDLARGRTIAGTGKINPDGSVGTIADLAAKATAARDVGADLLLFPAVQAAALADFDPGTMRLIPIDSLDDAIRALSDQLTHVD